MNSILPFIKGAAPFLSELDPLQLPEIFGVVFSIAIALSFVIIKCWNGKE